MSHKSLAEAAADVLNKSRADSVHMPMQKLQDVRGPQPNGVGEVDLGGATHKNPQGNSIGKVTAAHRHDATPPGVQPDPDTNEPMHQLDKAGGGREEASKVTLTKGHPTTSPDEQDGEGVFTAGHEYMHPTTEELEMTEEEIAEAKEEWKKQAKEKMMKMKGMKEDIDAILAGETFSEEFKEKVTTIFEAAVISRAVQVAEELENEIIDAAEESVEEIQAEMEEQINNYLTTMVLEWKEENQVAIESALKAELVEDFMRGLKGLFDQHYIEIPEEKIDVVESLTTEISELEEKLNKSLNSNIELTKRINEAKKLEIITQVCEGLTATQTSKVKTLAEGVEFVTEDEYRKKLILVRESYFNKVKKQDNQGSNFNHIAINESEEPAQVEEQNPLMDLYVQAISRTQR